MDSLDGATTYLPAGTGEVSTSAASTDGAKLALGSGSNGPTCVWTIAGNQEPSLLLKLPGHEGGTQALAFCGMSALASIGASDCLLLVQSLGGPGSMLISLSAPLPSMQLTLACSLGGEEISVGGPDGLLSWRVELKPAAQSGSFHGASSTDNAVGRLVAAQPLACPRHIAPPTSSSPSSTLTSPVITSLRYLDPPPFLLGGDSHGVLHLWGADESDALGSFYIGPGGPVEIDLIHAARLDDGPPLQTPIAVEPGLCKVQAPSTRRWQLVIAGAGGARTALRMLLSLSLGSDGGASPPPDPPSWQILACIRLDSDAIAMSWAPSGDQGIVGTAAGNLFHVRWAEPLLAPYPDDGVWLSTPSPPPVGFSAAAATAIVSAPPPPVRALAALAPDTSDSGCTGSRRRLQGGALLATASSCVESGGVLLWSAAAPGAPVMRVVHPAAHEASCVALARAEDGEEMCAVGFIDGAMRPYCQAMRLASVVCVPPYYCLHACAITNAEQGARRSHSSQLGLSSSMQLL
mmetsp:Transcript_5057/g.16106  ORF Transcript_5057/g.16106 Transcript_5057/m.16106 type:complete len:520 (+) Transcript_5057:1512-3071(+)|eukprot:scaffold76160_cov30-Tisochrysis_lutea.AAC.11